MIWNAICDRCSAKRKNTDLRKQWNGLMVCRDTCYEARNQQDYVKGVPDRQNPPWVRPEPAEVFVDAGYRLLETGALRLLEVVPLSSIDGVAARTLDTP